MRILLMGCSLVICKCKLSVPMRDLAVLVLIQGLLEPVIKAGAFSLSDAIWSNMCFLLLGGLLRGAGSSTALRAQRII